MRFKLAGHAKSPQGSVELRIAHDPRTHCLLWQLPPAKAHPRVLNSQGLGPIPGTHGQTRPTGLLTLLPAPPVVDRILVFRGTYAQSLEFGLVLDAKALSYERIELDEGWALVVDQALAGSAQEELARYANERTVRREEPAAILPFTSAGAGAIGYSMVLITVAYCAGINLLGVDWLAVGALDDSAAAAHEWWRALTALTLHLDQAHLFGNLMFGIGIGALASTLFGPGVAWASIVAAGAAANLIEMLILPSAHRSVGASTAVFAALGLLSGFAWRRRLSLRERWMYRWTPLLAGISLLGLMGAGTEHVDVVGHVLGFIAGVGLGWLYGHAGVPRNRNSWLQWVAGTLTLSSLFAAWYLALHASR